MVARRAAAPPAHFSNYAAHPRYRSPDSHGMGNEYRNIVDGARQFYAAHVSDTLEPDQVQAEPERMAAKYTVGEASANIAPPSR